MAVALVASAPVALAMSAAGAVMAGIAVAVLPWVALLLRPLLRLLPTSKMGWFYVAVILGVTVAPSLGAVGSVLRFVLAASTVVVAIFVYAASQRSEVNRAVPRSFEVLTALLVVVLLASALAAPSISFGLTRLVNWVMFMPAAFLVAVRPDWRGLGAGVVIAAVAQMGGVGLQLLGVIGGTWGGLLTSGSNYNPAAQNWLTRYTGLVLDPNNLAVILVLAILVCLAVVFGYRGRQRLATTAALLVLVAVFTFGVVLSGSRGGLLCLVLAVSIFAVRVGGRTLFLLGTAAVLGAVLAFSTEWDAVSLVVSSLGSIWDGTDASAGMRLGVWQSYLDHNDWFSYLVGQGFGGYFNGSLSDPSDFGGNADLLRQATVDNAWLKLLLESGLLGCVVLLSIVVIAGRSAWGRMGHMDIYCAAVLGALSSLLFRSLSVDALDINPWNAIIWMTFGACLAVRSTSPVPLGVEGQMEANTATVEKPGRAPSLSLRS